MPEGAICVQRFDDSLNSAIHITYRISLRSSSLPEPRDPLLKVFNNFFSQFSDRKVLKPRILRVFRQVNPAEAEDFEKPSRKGGSAKDGELIPLFTGG